MAFLSIGDSIPIGFNRVQVIEVANFGAHFDLVLGGILANQIQRQSVLAVT